MRVSLLITTYERPDALAAVLGSVGRQTVPPDEVIIGDDGSGPETAEVIRKAIGGGILAVHRWLTHDGFRAGRMRNHAAAAATGDYFIMIDDDILLHRDFVADHLAAAEKGFFVQGSRALLNGETSRLATEGRLHWPGLLTPGVEKRKNLLRSPRLLSALLRGPVRGLHGIRTCNFALWREDMERVNGFNEDFVGWGREDSEFANRLLNAGVRRRNLRFAALGCHLHHPPRARAKLADNDAILAASVDSGAARCERGLNLHSRD